MKRIKNNELKRREIEKIEILDPGILKGCVGGVPVCNAGCHGCGENGNCGCGAGCK